MKKKKEVKKARLSVTLQIGTKEYKGEGETIYDCLKGMKIAAFNHFGTFKVTEDGKTSELPLRLNSLRLKRMFMRDIDLQIFAKRLAVLR